MATLCSHPIRWDGRQPIEWCPETVALGSDYCPGHERYPATDGPFEADLRAREAAA